MCEACETRFYDLARERIVCPSCGALYTAVARPIDEANARISAPTAKTRWRSRPPRHPTPPVPVGDQDEAAAEVASDGADETPDTGESDDLVLDQEPDDGDVADLIVVEPKEP